MKRTAMVKQVLTFMQRVEARNPSFSVKCRIGASMVWDAEEKRLIN